MLAAAAATVAAETTAAAVAEASEVAAASMAATAVVVAGAAATLAAAEVAAVAVVTMATATRPLLATAPAMFRPTGPLTATTRALHVMRSTSADAACRVARRRPHSLLSLRHCYLKQTQKKTLKCLFSYISKIK